MAEHKIAKTSDIEQGTAKKFTIEGQTIAVFNKGEEFFAIEDTCKHRRRVFGRRRIERRHNYLSFAWLAIQYYKWGMSYESSG